MNYCEVFPNSLTPCIDFFLFIVWPVLILALIVGAIYALWGNK